MAKSLLLILLIGIPAAHFTVLGSESVVRGALLPAMVLICGIALALWFVVLFHKASVKQTGWSGGGDGGSSGIGGGEGD